MQSERIHQDADAFQSKQIQFGNSGEDSFGNKRQHRLNCEQSRQVDPQLKVIYQKNDKSDQKEEVVIHKRKIGRDRLKKIMKREERIEERQEEIQDRNKRIEQEQEEANKKQVETIEIEHISLDGLHQRNKKKREQMMVEQIEELHEQNDRGEKSEMEKGVDQESKDSRAQILVRENNYMDPKEKEDLQQIPVLQTSNKGIKIGIIGLFFLGIAGVTVYLAIHFSQQDQKVPHDQITFITPPAFPLNPVKSSRIVNRTYTENEVYEILYTVETEMSEDYRVKINYTCFFVVLENSEINSTQNLTQQVTKFSAAIVKTSEQKLSVNGTIEASQLYQDPSTFKSLLKYGKIPTNEFNNQTSENNTQMSCEEMKELYNQSNIICQSPILPVFDFSIFDNGKIQEFTFPTDFEKETLGLLRTFVKMFSPLLETDLYTQEKPKIVQKKLASNRPFASDEYNDPSQSLNEYSQEEHYSSLEGDNSVELKNRGVVRSASSTHNTNEQSFHNSKFSKSGKIESGSISSQTSFQSLNPENDSQNATNSSSSNVLFSPQSTDLHTNFSSHQECYMKVIEEFKADEQSVHKFQGILNNYQQQNQTLTVDVEGLINHILSQGNSGNQVAPGTTRLLLEQDGSLSLFKYDKQIKLLGTNVIGFQIAGYGYVKLNINLYEDPQDKDKKIPKITFDTGTILVLGNSHFPYSLVNYEKELHPITLKFTLTQIETVMDTVKSGFIKEIIEIGKMIKDGNFDGDLLPKVLEVASSITNLSDKLKLKINFLSPATELSQIYSSLTSLKSLYENKALELLNPTKNVLNSFVDNINAYAGATFKEALAVFKQTQDIFTSYSHEGGQYLENMKNSFIQKNITGFEERIKSLVSPQISEKYKEELQKAQNILDMIKYIQENGDSYAHSLEDIYASHKENLLGMIKQIADSYFSKQNSLMDSFNSQIQSQVTQQKKQIQDLQSKLGFLSSINSTVTSYLSKILSYNDINSSNYMNNFNNLLSTIQNSANNAASERKTDCCRHTGSWFWRKCAQSNNGQAGQIAQPAYWNATKALVQGYFQPAAQAATNFFSACQSIVNNKGINITEIFTQIQQKYSATLGASQYPVSNLTDTIQDNINKAQSAYNSVNCGPKGNLGNLIGQLGQLKTFIQNYDSVRKSFMDSYQSIIDGFSPEIYTKILVYSSITPSVKNFAENYYNQVSDLVSNFSGLYNVIVNYTSIDLVQGGQIKNKISQFYDRIDNLMKMSCSIKAANQQQIDSFRSQYSSNLKDLASASSTALSDHISQCNNFLKAASTSILTSYQNFDFCSNYNNYHSQMDNLIQDFQNFTLFTDLWDDFQTLKKESHKKVNQIQESYSHAKSIFLQLSTPQSFKEFINSLKNLSATFSTAVANISSDFSEFRQKANKASVFQTPSQEQIASAIQQLGQTSFNLDSSEIYPQISELITSSLATIEKLNFDVINVYLAGRNIQEFFENTIDQFKNGSDQLKSRYLSLCQQFVDLKDDATQDYLNKINNQLQNFTATIVETVFPNLTQGVQDIQNKFKSYQFKNEQLKSAFDKSLQTLNELNGFMLAASQKISSQLSAYSNKLMELIKKLEISSLNSLYKLSKIVIAQFENFSYTLNSILKKIEGFPSKISESLNNIFTFPKFLANIQEEFNSELKEMNETIMQSFETTEEDLQKNSEFYNKFVNSSIYEQIKNLSQSAVVLDVQQLWKQAQSSVILQKISDLIEKVRQKLSSSLQKMTDARDRIKDIEQNVKNKVAIIDQHFHQIKGNLTNIQNLIFGVLEANLGQTVMENIRNISGVVDSIVDIDFAALGKIAKQDFGNEEINTLVEKVVGFYDKIQPKKQEFLQKMDKVMGKIDDFLKTELAGKVSKLQQGINYLKSKSNLQDPVESYTLYQKNLLHKEIPLLPKPYEQIIPTCIGTFRLELRIDFILTANLQIALQKFRNIEVMTNFTAKFSVEVSFGYGIAHILEFGLYVKGDLLKAQLVPYLFISNAIPFQMIEAVSDVPELSNENKLTVDFITDLTLYAISVEIGFYLTHIWIELIWTRIHFCINLIFTSFCISFDIPIGFKFVEIRKDWGSVSGGKVLAKTRLFDWRILTIKL